MMQRTALVQITNRILLMSAALAGTGSCTLAAHQPPTGESTRLGEFAGEKHPAFEPTAEGDWVLVLDDAARKPLEPGIKLHKP